MYQIVTSQNEVKIESNCQIPWVYSQLGCNLKTMSNVFVDEGYKP